MPFDLFSETVQMEKKAFGVLLTILGIVGLIAAAWYFIQTNGTTRDIKTITVFSILGIIFFFAGIGLMRTTRDRSV
jgi:uncharacterized membrane protein